VSVRRRPVVNQAGDSFMCFAAELQW
jgi:hypothetical protein